MPRKPKPRRPPQTTLNKLFPELTTGRYGITTPAGHTVEFERLEALPRLLVDVWKIDLERARLWSEIAKAEILNGEVFTVPQTAIRVERLP